MDDYISRNDAIKACRSATDPYEPISHDVAIECAVAKINQVPAADVVEVVRCRDCKYYHNPNSSEQLFCYWIEPNEDDFCSCGERRAEDGN